MRASCPPDHKHEKATTCYITHKCGCDPCREGMRDRARLRRKQIAYGRYDSGLVDVQPVREHIHMLQAYGIGWKRIAELSGVGYTAVETILYGQHDRDGEPRKRIRRDKAEKILAVQPTQENLRSGALVPAYGAQRRIQALGWNGWPMAWIAEELGIQRSNFQAVLKRTEIHVKTHEAVCEVFERLWNQAPVAVTAAERTAVNRARNIARRNGWRPALSWDDIDNRRERPKGIVEGGGVNCDSSC